MTTPGGAQATGSAEGPFTASGDVIRCLLVDEHALSRAGLRALLEAEPDLRVVAEADGLEQGRGLLEAIPVDVVLVGLSSPEVLEGLARLPSGDVGGHARYVVVAPRMQAQEVRKLMLAGVVGFVSTRSPVAEFLRVVRTAAGGQITLCPHSTRLMATLLHRGSESAQLTARQLEVLAMIQKGLTTREIAEHLFLSPRTVEKHRRDILRLLDARNTPHALRLASGHGLL